MIGAQSLEENGSTHTCGQNECNFLLKAKQNYCAEYVHLGKYQRYNPKCWKSLINSKFCMQYSVWISV